MSVRSDELVAQAAGADACQEALERAHAAAEDDARATATAATDAQFRVFGKSLALHALQFGESSALAVLAGFLRDLRATDPQTHFDISGVGLADAATFLTCAFLEDRLRLDLRRVPVFAANLDLAVYARSGVAPVGVTSPLRDASADLLRWAEARHAEAARVPRRWHRTAAPFLVLRQAVLARALLGADRAVSLEGLAALSGLSLKSIQNLASQKKGPIPHRNGAVEAGSAIAWLRGRDVVIVAPADGEDDDEDIDGVSEPDDGMAIRVPVDRDGNRFGPWCRRERGYKVGPKDRPVYVADFFKALARLQAMKTPLWRARRVDGTWAVARGVGWASLTYADIRDMFEAHGMRLDP